MKKNSVFRIPMSGPSDVSGLASHIDEGKIKSEEIVAIMAKTEGNGCVNDFTRGYSTYVFQDFISSRLGLPREEVAKRVAFIMSGGTEGVLCPHATVFTNSETNDSPGGEKRLVVGVNHSRSFLPEEIGRAAQVAEVSRVVRETMEEIGIDSSEDVHFVQIKCPLLTSERIEEARTRGHTVATVDTYESMAFSRGASALGIASALGEVEESKISDEAICEDWSLYSEVASTSAGVELMNCEIIVMGNSTSSTSDYVISHSVMKDAIDGAAVIDALRGAGARITDGRLNSNDSARVINVFAKAEANPSGSVRGRWHTMLNDSDINNTRHARAVVGAVIASIVGDPMIYVSGGSEHQGPAGGGPVAVVALA